MPKERKALCVALSSENHSKAVVAILELLNPSSFIHSARV